jgi:hypothetical protein
MSRRAYWARLVALALGTAVAAVAAPTEDLVGADLSSWRGDTGTWRVAGSAVPDPENAKRLATTPGAGVLVNGPDGKTSDILSRLEHGDAEIHVEFMVPKGANSGVYLQGREVSGPTRAATFDDEKPRGPLMLQGDHGPVAYRNVVVRPFPRP